MSLTKYILGDIALSFSYGSMPKEDDLCEEGYPVFSGYRTVGYSKIYNINKRSLVVVARGVGGTGNVEIAEEKTFLTNLSIAIRINEELADIDYLKYYLNAQGLRYLDTGAAQSQITINNLRHHKVFIPSIDEQKKIAAIITAYDKLVKTNNKRIKVLEKMAENLYKEWFVRFRFPGHEMIRIINGIPNGWEYVSVESVSAMLQRGISPEYDDDGDLMVISQKCIRQSIMDIHEARRQTKGYKQALNLLDGDTVICSTGTGTLGRVGQVYGDYPGTTFDSHVTLVRAKTGISKHFLFWTLKAREYWFMNMGIGSTNQQELYKKTIQNTKVLLPEQNMMMDFERIIELIHQNIVIIMQSQENLIMQRNLLLPRLMSGKLAV